MSEEAKHDHLADIRDLIDAAELPPEALPSDAFFSKSVDREVSAAASAASAAAGAAPGAPSAAGADPAASGYDAEFARLIAIQEERERLMAEAEKTRPVAAPERPLRIGVLLSGSGTNLQAIIDRIADGTLPNVEISLVVSSRPSAKGLQRAEAAGLQTLTLSKEIYADPFAADEVIASELKRCDTDYVIMAGYMRMVHAPLLASFPNRVVNLHPALLPSFQGAHAIQDAFDRGVKATGVTVHFANEVYDQGPIIAQRALAVEEGWDVDTLEEHIHAIEHELYPQVIGWLAAGRVHVGADLKVTIDPE